MQKQDIETILASQRKFFATGKTLPISWRLEQLKKLRASMLRHEEDALIHKLVDFITGEELLAIGDEESLTRLHRELIGT